MGVASLYHSIEPIQMLRPDLLEKVMQNNMMTKEQFEHLKERLSFGHKDMSHEASDYRSITEHPIFYVQDLHEMVGMQPDYSNQGPYGSTEYYTIIYDGSHVESYKSLNDLRESCEDFEDFKDTVKECDEIGCMGIWFDVCAHLTREAAQLYIDQNKHNLKSPRIYVKSMNRCHEMISLVEAIINGNLVYKDQ